MSANRRKDVIRMSGIRRMEGQEELGNAAGLSGYTVKDALDVRLAAVEGLLQEMRRCELRC